MNIPTSASDVASGGKKAKGRDMLSTVAKEMARLLDHRPARLQNPTATFRAWVVRILAGENQGIQPVKLR